MYEKGRRDKAPLALTISKMDGRIRTMEEEGRTTSEMAPIINITQVLAMDHNIDGSDRYTVFRTTTVAIDNKNTTH